MGGPQPYVPVQGLDDDSATHNPGGTVDLNGVQFRRARVLCSYDAKDGTELNLNANEVSFDILMSFEHIRGERKRGKVFIKNIMLF